MNGTRKNFLWTHIYRLALVDSYHKIIHIINIGLLSTSWKPFNNARLFSFKVWNKRLDFSCKGEVILYDQKLLPFIIRF